jgi:hypothetical protein
MCVRYSQFNLVLDVLIALPKCLDEWPKEKILCLLDYCVTDGAHILLLEKLKEILDKRSVKWQSECIGGTTILSKAIDRENVEVVSWLLSSGVNPKDYTTSYSYFVNHHYGELRIDHYDYALEIGNSDILAVLYEHKKKKKGECNGKYEFRRIYL